MDAYKLKFTKLQTEIFSLLCINAGSGLTQRTIARLLEVSPTAIAKSLPLLEKEGVTNIKRGTGINLNYVTLNRENKKVIHLKRVENLRQVYVSGLQEFLEDSFPGGTVILFGSYAKGDDTTKSDIDIAVIGRKEKKLILTEYEKILGREIRINFYTSFKEIHIYLKANILSGMLMSGTIEL